MKLKIITLLFLSTLIWACSEKTASKYDGSWKLIECKWAFDDSKTFSYPGNINKVEGSWIITDNHGIYLIQYTVEGDSTVYTDYGKSTVKFENNTVTEKYLISNEENLVGQTISFEVEQKGDTLIFKGPSGNGKDVLDYSIYEVFVRE
jgi:hypothetical protein